MSIKLKHIAPVFAAVLVTNSAAHTEEDNVADPILAEIVSRVGAFDINSRLTPTPSFPPQHPFYVPPVDAIIKSDTATAEDDMVSAFTFYIPYDQHTLYCDGEKLKILRSSLYASHPDLTRAGANAPISVVTRSGLYQLLENAHQSALQPYEFRDDSASVRHRDIDLTQLSEVFRQSITDYERDTGLSTVVTIRIEGIEAHGTAQAARIRSLCADSAHPAP